MAMPSQNRSIRNKLNGGGLTLNGVAGNTRTTVGYNPQNKDVDLECDEILTKPNLMVEDSEFTCNETLQCIPTPCNDMDRMETKRLAERR
jgi:hypothetical protein